MELKDLPVHRTEAARLWDEHESRSDGAALVNSLGDGLSILRNLLFARVHEDVQAKFGLDSMLLPVSPIKSEQIAKLEIELFALAESAAHVRARRYVSDPTWFLSWLTALRLGEHRDDPKCRRRIDRYLSEDADRRRLTFSNYLERNYAEARRAPLILYRLFPLSVAVSTSLAFRDPFVANELRNQQMFWLPAIQDCHECHGAPLENGETCHVCGNPVWTYRWLTVAD
jgi:hypothetical protein